MALCAIDEEVNFAPTADAIVDVRALDADITSCSDRGGLASAPMLHVLV